MWNQYRPQTTKVVLFGQSGGARGEDRADEDSPDNGRRRQSLFWFFSYANYYEQAQDRPMDAKWHTSKLDWQMHWPASAWPHPAAVTARFTRLLGRKPSDNGVPSARVLERRMRVTKPAIEHRVNRARGRHFHGMRQATQQPLANLALTQ